MARLWQFTRMPLVLANATATFQRLIDALFGPECEPYVFCYLDDIIGMTKTFDEHMKWLENYAEMKLPINKLTFKGKKWE